MTTEEVDDRCREIVGYCIDRPGVVVHVATGYNSKIVDVILLRMVSSIDNSGAELARRTERSVILFKNGSRIELRSYDGPDAVRGWEAHVIWFVRDTFSGVSAETRHEIEMQLRCRLRARTPNYDLVWVA